MPKVTVIKDFCGEEAEVKKYGNSRGIIPSHLTDRFGNTLKRNVIELSEARALKLMSLKSPIVEAYKPEHDEPLKAEASNKAVGVQSAVSKPGPAAVQK